MVDGRRGDRRSWLFNDARCAHCHAPAFATELCAACIDALPWIDPACPGCALPLPAGVGGFCAACARRPRPWAAAYCALRYAAPADRWVQRLKYRHDLAAARRLGWLLAQGVRHAGMNAPELVIPMPLHRARQRERGFNQADEIARALAREWRLPVAASAARQLHPTGDQTGLSAAERRRNMRDAFTADPRRVRDRHVAIVDDVLTTGASCEALCAALHAAGAGRVQVWCCARTP